MGQVPQEYMGKIGQLPEDWLKHELVVILTVPTDVREFPDISFYQGNINFTTMKTQADNVIIRAGQQTWVDSKWTVNWPAAKAAGLRRGCYWFFDGRASPEAQWNALKPLIASDRPETRVWVDWELVYGGNYEGPANVVKLMKSIEGAGHSVGIYTGYYFFNDHCKQSANPNEWNYFKTKPLWMAAYTADGSSNNLLIPPPWDSTTIELHQWGTPSIGHDYGVESIEIDMNRVLNNSEVYMSNPNPPSNGAFRYNATALGNGTRLRYNPNTTNGYANSYNAGTTFQGDELFIAPVDLSNASGVYQRKGDQWLKVKKVNNAPPLSSTGAPITQDVWVAIIHMGGAICSLVDNGPPPEPTPQNSVTVIDDQGTTWKSTTITEMT